MVVTEMETFNEYQAAQFRVALLLKKYKFGAVSAAKYLNKPRGLVQSWMQIGNKHHLAKEKIRIKSFEKILKNLRRRITKEHMDYFLVKRLFVLSLPVSFISKTLEIPTSTVRSWRLGKVPVDIKQFFYDRKLVDSQFNKLLKSLKMEITSHNIEYFISLRLAHMSQVKDGRRRIGGRIISNILTNHFGYIEPIPEKTISCWIDGKRKPWDAFKALMDERMIEREINKIIDELTYKYLSYHLSRSLADQHGWRYSKISKVLDIDKELVRGWVKKNRGNPVAKIFYNDKIVEDEIEKYLNDYQPDFEDDKNKCPELTIEGTLSSASEGYGSKNIESENDDQKDIINKNLEHELIYHLETIPTGVTSAKVLKSILIHCNSATVAEIQKVLNLSKSIVRDKRTGKWMLKRYFENNADEATLEGELAQINCKKGQNDEVIC